MTNTTTVWRIIWQNKLWIVILAVFAKSINFYNDVQLHFKSETKANYTLESFVGPATVLDNEGKGALIGVITAVGLRPSVVDITSLVRGRSSFKSLLDQRTKDAAKRLVEISKRLKQKGGLVEFTSPEQKCLGRSPFTLLSSIYHHRRWIKQQIGNHLRKYTFDIKHFTYISSTSKIRYNFTFYLNKLRFRYCFK